MGVLRQQEQAFFLSCLVVSHKGISQYGKNVRNKFKLLPGK